MLAEILQVVEAERRSLDDLGVRLRQARDERTALALRREIEQVKMEAEIRMLQVQADHARRRGLATTAGEIEAAIDALRGGPGAPAAGRPPEGGK